MLVSLSTLGWIRAATLLAAVGCLVVLWEAARQPPVTGVRFLLVEEAEIAPLAGDDDPRQLDLEPGRGTELAREPRPPAPGRRRGS